MYIEYYFTLILTVKQIDATSLYQNHGDKVYLLAVTVLLQYFLGGGEGKPKAVPHGVSHTCERLSQCSLPLSEET